MKICIVSEVFAPQPQGGAEISSRHTAANLAQRHQVVVLALGLAGVAEAEPGERTTDAAYRLYRIPYRNSYLPSATRPQVSKLTKVLWHLRNARGAVHTADLRAFLTRENVDLIYAQNSSRFQPALYQVAAEMGIPVCQHLRDYALLCPKASMYRHGMNCARPCTACRLLTARARAETGSVRTVIAVSDFVRRRYIQNGLFPRADFHVLHNTNTARADFDAALLAARPAPEPGFTFGYLGTISPEKGVEVLVDAFCALPPTLPARLLLAGRGEPAFVTKMQAKTSVLPPGRVEWLGHVRPETVYGRSEVIVVPSLWHEPQSRVLVEAATYGVPVFASRTGGSPEIVEGNGTGWCYDPNDRARLTSLMQDTAEMSGIRWRSEIETLFPAIAEFKGSAEESDFNMRLRAIIESTTRPSNWRQ